MNKFLSSLSLLLVLNTAHAAEPLPKFTLADQAIQVIGLSSGGMMAMQYHAAFSASVKGAAILAAGPYHCAGDNDSGEMNVDKIMPCLNGNPDPALSLGKLRQHAAAGLVDDLQHLRQARVYLFRGLQDQWISPGVFNALRSYYQTLTPAANIRIDDARPVGHAFITDNPSDPACEASEAPFVTHCGFDQAGDILRWLANSPLQARAEKPSGRIVAFNQKEFAGPSGLSLEDKGYLYVPAACAAGEACSLQVVFHGCGQSAETIGDKVYGWPGAGFNRWADTNRMLVLYPQVGISFHNPANPLGCWDWWGANDAAWDTRNGKQLQAIKAMVERIAGKK